MRLFVPICSGMWLMSIVLLINPNSSIETTQMMVRMAQDEAPPGITVIGRTAASGPLMIIDEQELGAASLEVERIWRLESSKCDGVVIAGFGDPGLSRLRALTHQPVIGICEASMLEAAASGGRFGIATVTPRLIPVIDAVADRLGLCHLYTGVRLTVDEPRGLTRDAERLEAQLGVAIDACIHEDGAQTVIIGGGPLSTVAQRLAARSAVPILVPIRAAMRQVAAQLMPVHNVPAMRSSGVSL